MVRVIRGDVYTYVGNDPLDKTDPSGRDELAEIVVTARAAPFEFPSFLTSIASFVSTPAFATVGVAVIGLAFPSSLSANDTCNNGNCNTLNAKATGTPPVPG